MRNPPTRPLALAARLAALGATLLATLTLGPRTPPTLAQAQATPLVQAPRDQGRPRVSGNLVVWEDSRSYNPDTVEPAGNIFARGLTTGETRQLTSSGHAARPALFDSIVVWTDARGMSLDVYAAPVPAH